MSKCYTCHWSDICSNRNKQGTAKESYQPLTQRNPKPYCFVCGHTWVKHNDFKYRKCDVCDAVKDLNDDSVQIKHTRG